MQPEQRPDAVLPLESVAQRKPQWTAAPWPQEQPAQLAPLAPRNVPEAQPPLAQLEQQVFPRAR